MNEITMTPENRPYLDALIRLVALGRNADAEDKLVEAIQELMQRRAEVAEMRPLVEAVATLEPQELGDDRYHGGFGYAIDDVDPIGEQARAFVTAHSAATECAGDEVSDGK